MKGLGTITRRRRPVEDSALPPFPLDNSTEATTAATEGIERWANPMIRVTSGSSSGSCDTADEFGRAGDADSSTWTSPERRDREGGWARVLFGEMDATP